MGFPTDDEDAQRRMIILKTTDDAGEPVTVLNGYFPQGENEKHETKYPAKRKFYKDLMTYLDDNHTPDDNVIVMGDVNISHTDLDIGSWFDYRSKGFNDNRGLRIDLILATKPLHAKLHDAGIDYELRGIEKPSDHAPIWAEYKG